LALSITPLPDGLSVAGITLYNCSHSDSAQIAGSGPVWVIDDSVLVSLGFTTGTMSTSDSCLSLSVHALADCRFRNDSLLPDLILQGHDICGNFVEGHANFGQGQFLDTLQSACTSCYTITKTALQDTIIAGDPVQFQIVVTSFNADSSWVFFHEWLPQGFTITSVVPDSILLPAIGSDTIIVEGFYTLSGNCNDPGMLNTATIYFGADSIQDDACIHVYASCAAQANTIVPDSSFASAYPGGFIGQNVYLDGRFYVDVNSFLIQSSHLWVNTGGQIIILNGYSMTVDSSVIEGCDFMWQGIYMEKNTALGVIEHSTLRDANKAIYANDKTELKLLNSSYEDNVWSLYVPYNSGINNIGMNITGNRFGMFAPSLKPGYPGQQPFGTLPYCGMELNDVVNQIGYSAADSNWFYNMNAGIVGFRSTLNIQSNKFEQIQPDNFITWQPWNGAAIAVIGTNTSPGDVDVSPVNSHLWTMDSCLTGIYTEYSKMSAYQVNMTAMRTGVTSRNCYISSSVSYCNIQASNYGIDWRLNSGASSMIASRNTITISGSKFGIGINLEELTTAGNPNYYIDENYNISIISSMAGIRARNVYNPMISKNTINQLTNGISTPITFGILLENDSTGTVQCNTVVSNDITNTDTYGMEISATKGTTISCNEIDSSQIGFHFIGLSPLFLSANSMKNNFWGLEIDTLTEIGPQKNKGNIWLNYRDTVGAVNWNYTIPGLQGSVFRTSGAYPSIYWPLIASWESNWFKFLSDPEEGCGHTCDVQQLADTTRDESLEMSIAQGSYSTTQENVVVADQYLFDLLAGDSVMLHSESAFENFYASHESGTVGQINEVANNIKAAYQIDSVIADSIELIQVASTNTTSNLYALDSLSLINMPVDYMSQREFMISNRDSIAGELEDLLIQKNQHSNAFFDSASTLNQNVVASQIPQQNELTINEACFKFIAFGSDTLLSNFPEVLNIAHQCPSVGGPAVYRARTLVALITDTIDYDDACQQTGSLRIQLSATKKRSTPMISVIPNPANNKITISINQTLEGMCRIEIANLLGETVLSQAGNCKEQKFSLNTAYLNPGIYSVRLITGSVCSNIVKLVIAR